jgi:hypothetical protein
MPPLDDDYQEDQEKMVEDRNRPLGLTLEG